MGNCLHRNTNEQEQEQQQADAHIINMLADNNTCGPVDINMETDNGPINDDDEWDVV